jgi:MoaA/NifB/PqqE/SkfB family radical SAM enzyme
MSELTKPDLRTAARIANRALNNREYDDGAVVLESLPLALFVELTKNCNLHCPICRPKLAYDAAFNMPMELFERVAAELFPTATLVDLRGWGESVLLRNFDRFIEIAASYRPQLRLVTNGQINRPAVWDRLMAAHAIVVASCDAASPELFATLRAGGTMERFRSCVQSLVRRRDAHGAPRENVVLTCVASPHNLQELSDVVALAAELDVAKVILFPVQTNHEAGAPEQGETWSMAQHERELAIAYERAIERGRTEGVIVQLGAAPTEGLALPELVKPVPCMHPWSYAYVDHRGNVGFCDHLIGEPKHVFESVLDKPFAEIWNGPDFVQLRTAHRGGTLPDRFAECRWCYRQRYVDFEERFHDKYATRRVATDARRTLLAISPTRPS